jgi:hypothetical protein
MIAVINFVSIIIVTCAVAFHYFVFFDNKKRTEAAIKETKQQTADAITATKKETANDLRKTKYILDESIAKTNTSLTKTNDDLAKTSTSLNNQFKTLSEQVTTKNLSVASDATIGNMLKTSKVQLGDKWTLSGKGDAHANDDWLRVMNKDSKDYYGGVAMGKLWVGNDAEIGNSANVGNVMKAGKVQLGDKWILSGKGDKYANDDWLRLMGKDGKGYYGGFATNKLWVGSNAEIGNVMKTNKVKLGDKWTLSGNGDGQANDDWLRLTGKDGKGYYGGFAANKLWVGGDVDVGNAVRANNLNVRANTTTNALNANTLKVNNATTVNSLNANTLKVNNATTVNALNANTLKVNNAATANTLNANKLGVANKYFFGDSADGMLKVTGSDGNTLSKVKVGTATANNALCIQNVCVTKDDLTRMKYINGKFTG